MLERLRLSALVKDVEKGGDIDVVLAAEAEATIDAIKADALGVSKKQQATIADLQGRVEAAQNELLALREIVGEWCWNISNLTGDYAIKTVADFNEEVTRRAGWLSETVRATLPAPQSNSDRQELQALQQRVAQLEGELATAKAPRVYDCGSCAIGKGFEQRVAQLEGDVEEQKRNYLNACETIYKMYVAATGREGVAPKRGVVEDLADLQGQLLEWKRALHSLTPGGSEYANDLKACVEWVREARSRQHETIIDGVKQRKALQQRVAQLEGERDALFDENTKLHGWVSELAQKGIRERKIEKLQADHATLMGLVRETVQFFESNFENAGLELCGLMGGRDITHTGQRLNELIEQLAASLPAQPAQGE